MLALAALSASAFVTSRPCAPIVGARVGGICMNDADKDAAKAAVAAKIAAAKAARAAEAAAAEGAPPAAEAEPAAAMASAVADPTYNMGQPGMSKSIPFLKQPVALDGSMAGDIGFDPLGLTEVVPLAWAREAELKHARVCMLAVAGYVSVDLGFRVPGAPEVSSLYAHDACVDNGSMLFMLLPLAVIEITTGIPKVFQLLNDPDARPPGDFGFDPLGLSATGPPEMKFLMQEKELANGRAAMLAFSGIVTQSQLTGGGFPYTYSGNAADFIPPLAWSTLPGICASGIKNYCQ